MERILKFAFTVFWLILLIIVTLNIVSSKALCDVEEGTPIVWLGDEDDAFYCQGNMSHCSHFGLEYICEDPNGGSLGNCTNSTKVMCASPISIPLAAPTTASTIRVVAYNIWELRYLYYQNGQRERTCRTTRELFRLRQDIDVIVFNEAFMGGCFAKFNSSIDSSVLTIRDILIQYGFVYFTKTVGDAREFPKFENGGVFIASRWPIIEEAQTVYTDAVKTTSDFLSAKGAMYARVVKTVEDKSRTYHILGTHLQATKSTRADRVRVNQATEMYDLMISLNLPEDEPVIYAGDLNADLYKTNSTNAEDVFNALDAVVPPIVGEYRYSSDGPTNDVKDSNGQSFIDYVIYSHSNLQPIKATMEVIRPRAQEDFDICLAAISPIPTYPNSDKCRKSENITDLSDHFAVLGVLEYQELEITTEPSGITTDSGNGRVTQDFIMGFMPIFLIIVWYI